MKSKDFTLIILVVLLSSIFSIVVTSIFISTPKNRQEKVEVVGKITTDFPEVDKKFFNENSIDPTLLIVVTPNNNPKPFQQSNR